MTLMDSRPGIVGVVAKVADDDEGAALTLLQFGFYEALCDEADRIRPRAERRAAQEIIKRTDGAMERLARRYAASDEVGKAAAAAIADELLVLRQAAEVVLAKKERNWHGKEPGERDPESGQFVRRGVRGAILDMLGIGTRAGQGGDSQPSKTRETLDSIVGEDADTFTRLQTLGQGLVRSSNPTARGAGVAARIVGDVGPEAQRALEPGIRRTAYRYRGTERKPSAAAQRDAKQMFDSIQAGENASQDQARLQAQGDFGATLLYRQIPTVEMARISLEAGKMPPSVGLMFDGEGNLVSEAMGFNGDHYLPFDLKNLKRLKGGHYVRTRTTGGPTEEDVYTALLSGARQVQVISNSGVFTMEFDPAMRGGRRYSDKARSMVDRYSKLVAAIGSGKLMQTDFSPEEMNEIRRDAWERSGHDEKLMQDYVDEAVRVKRQEARFSEPDEDALMAEAHEEALAEYKGQRDVSSRQILQRRNELFQGKIRDHREGTARAYRLDGEGYKAAMKALETEFPYFIRSTSFQPLSRWVSNKKGLVSPNEKLPTRGGSDMGYTKPGELAPAYRPESERTGYKEPRAARPPSVPASNQDETPASGPDAATSAPAGATSDLRRGLPEPDAPTLEQLAQRNKTEVRLAVQGGIGQALEAAGQLAGAIEANAPDTEGDDSLILGPGIKPPMYLAWLVERFNGDTGKMAGFLAQKENAAYRVKTKEALAYVAGQVQQAASADFKAQYPAGDFTAAAASLDMLDGVGALFEDGEDAANLIAPVNASAPKPKPIPEVIALGASMKNIAAFAQRNPDVAKIAAELQASPDGVDAAAVALIEEPANQHRLGLKSAKAGEVKHGFKGDLAAARQHHHLQERHPAHIAVRNAHTAWALVKLEEAVRTLTESEPVSFADVGPKAKAPEGAGTAAKRYAGLTTRVVMVDRDSPISKALAARASRSRSRATLLGRRSLG